LSIPLRDLRDRLPVIPRNFISLDSSAMRGYSRIDTHAVRGILAIDALLSVSSTVNIVMPLSLTEELFCSLLIESLLGEIRLHVSL
jgi:hypothetical protein